MIFPGHLAATVLSHRYLKVAFWPAFWAGLLPDVIDKTLYYVLHVVPGSRVPMHTLWGWLGSTLLLGLGASLLARSRAKLWAVSWFVGYGAHLLCDSPLAGGSLPFLWPLQDYGRSSSASPLSYLFGGEGWVVWMLTAEVLLVLAALVTSPAVRSWLSSRRSQAPLTNPRSNRKSAQARDVVEVDAHHNFATPSRNTPRSD